jgi:hypothetical protein
VPLTRLWIGDKIRPWHTQEQGGCISQRQLQTLMRPFPAGLFGRLDHRAGYYFSDAESDLRIIDELAIPGNQGRKQVLGNIVTEFSSRKISVWIIR